MTVLNSNNTTQKSMSITPNAISFILIFITSAFDLLRFLTCPTWQRGCRAFALLLLLVVHQEYSIDYSVFLESDYSVLSSHF